MVLAGVVLATAAVVAAGDAAGAALLVASLLLLLAGVCFLAGLCLACFGAGLLSAAAAGATSLPAVLADCVVAAPVDASVAWLLDEPIEPVVVLVPVALLAAGA